MRQVRAVTMADEWPKTVSYRGIIFVLKKCDGGSYEFYLDAGTGGLGFWSEDDARKAAEKAIDRKLDRGRAKA